MSNENRQSTNGVTSENQSSQTEASSSINEGNNQNEIYNWDVRYWLRLLINILNNRVLNLNYPPILTNLLFVITVLLGGTNSLNLIEEIKSNTTTNDYLESSIDLKDVCSSNLHKEQGANDLNLRPESITVEEPLLIENNKLWPVFRWRCVYINKSFNNKDRTLRSEIGMDLPSYCKNDGRIKDSEAQYKSHQDPNSWYCTIVDDNKTDKNNSENKITETK